jgi:hypothetical protein
MIKIFNKLIEVRDIAHQIHLIKSDTQSKHEALEEFYNSLLIHTDIFIEVYSGQFGLMDNFGEFNTVDYNDHITYFENFAKFMHESRKDIVDEAIHLNAIVDDIVTITYKLIYKLKYLQ